MSDIREWLNAQGLVQYADTFDENEIDLDLVRDLDDAALKDLGVAIMGHRVRLLRAIAELDASVSGDPAPAIAPAMEAERRQITVMFCDLVGSTALSEKLDPEDLRELMKDYQQSAGGVIESYGGHVAQYLGDGLMTYFGWPQAHEDDAERAVRASLEIIDTVNTLNLQVRIGIATGPVVVGETGAGDASVPKLAVGETPNLAARLQGLANADQIVVAELTRRLLGGTFELAELGAQPLKGILQPVSAYRVVSVAETESRFEARHQQLTPLIGRKAEMAMVMARWEQAKSGEGQVIVLGGEPGIGKSRITQTLRERVAGEPHTRLRYQCSPYHANSALHPVIEQLERAAGFAREDTADEKLDKLEHLIPASPDVTARALFASLLMLPVERYPTRALSPQKQKEETLQALADQVVALAAIQPVLLVFEDTHWIDPTSQEALDLIVPIVANHRALVVITHRPEYDPPWLGHGHITPLALTRLARAEAAEMVAEISEMPLTDEMLGQIVAKTDGVPLFVEELTKTVVESGAETANTIPDTLQDSLMARLDRLSPVKEVAQIGACIGREFSYQLISDVADLGDNAMQDALQQLVNSELIFRQGTPPNATYVFKHALVQDTAYDSLLKSRRVGLHARIAETLAATSGPEAQQPDVIAHHYAQASEPTQAIPYWLAAAQKAFTQSANTEALSHVQSGLECVDALPEGQERPLLEVGLRSFEGVIYSATRGYGVVEVHDAFARAEALCNEIGDTPALFPVLFGIAVAHWVGGDTRKGVGVYERMFSLANAGTDNTAKLVSEASLGAALLNVGEYARGRPLLLAALERYDPADHAKLAVQYGQDQAILAATWLAWGDATHGHFASARKHADDAVSLMRTCDHPFSHTLGYSMNGFAYAIMGDADSALDMAACCIELGEEQRLPFWLAWGYCDRAVALRLKGDFEGSQLAFDQALAVFEMTGGTGARAYVLTEIALTAMGRDDLENAERLLDEAERIVGSSGEILFSPGIAHARGLLSVERRSARTAEDHFHDAIRAAKAQDNHLVELRAARDLARLWHAQDRSGDAKAVLEPALAWFTDGHDLPDLTAAKALLEDLK